MPYLNMDDNFPDHPKVDGLSDGAFRLHVSAMCYAAKHLTDGYIPPERVSRLTPRYKPGQRDELIKAGLWVGHDTGHLIHDYLDWNKSRAWWQAKRAATAARVAKWRKGKGEDPHDDEPPEGM
jgi:hypothetical protein